MNVTPKSKVLGLRPRMCKSRRQLMQENTNKNYAECTDPIIKTDLIEGGEQLQSDNNDNNSSCMVTPVKPKLQTETDSPDVNQSSPFIQSLLPKTFGSPEIDVSWDWSCSQMPVDSVDSFVPKAKHDKRRNLQRRLPRALPPEAIFRPRLPPGKCISEEEQKKRVEFYRELCNEIKGSSVETEVSLIKSIVHKNSEESEPSLENEVEKYESLFDDSTNEIMLECSQAIEKVFSVKTDQISSNFLNHPEEMCYLGNKHSLSPDVTNVKVKKMSHTKAGSRTKLCMDNSENTKAEVRSTEVDEDTYFAKGDQTYMKNKLVDKSCDGRTKTFQNKPEFKNPHHSLNCVEGNYSRVDVHQVDVTTLFNDDNDDDFSSLCFDTLDSISVKHSKKKSSVETKRCSQTEIEEKRKQALNKLKKKKK